MRLTTREQLQTCCETALAQYPALPSESPIRQFLGELQQREAAETARREHLARRRAQLGGHEDGYYVIFAHPVKLGYLSPVEHVVQEGLDAAVGFIHNLKANWSWEL